MNNSDKIEFAELMTGNGEIYNKSVSKSLMQIYFDAFADYSIEDIKKGFSKHSLDPKHGSFFPKPADIVRHLQLGQLSTSEKAELAWAQIQHCLRINGTYGGLKIDDKQGIAALKSFTTWQEFCAMDVSKQTWAKKEFISMYSTYENTPVELLPSSLPGLTELHNHKQEQKQIGAQSISSIMERISNNKNSES